MRAFVMLWLLALPVAAAEPLLETTTDWQGGKLAYPAGDAKVTSIILRMEGEEPAPFHCHPVPTMGYVLSGEAEVETRDGRTLRLKQGDALVEVMRTVHRGRAIGGPVEIVVFYAGAEGVPVTVRPEDDPDHSYCNP